ncbi:MAG: hypothetical protein GX435_01650 [Exilispira sp.]|nr:hypothetical protein [Exilispira sp.]
MKLLKYVLLFIVTFLPLLAFFNINISAQGVFFPTWPVFTMGGEYGTRYYEEDDEEYTEYNIVKAYAKITEEIFSNIFYIADFSYSQYDYENDTVDKESFSLYNYIKIKTFPYVIINLIFAYKDVTYTNNPNNSYTFYKVGFNFKYRFMKYAYIYLSYFYSKKIIVDGLDYSLNTAYISLEMPVWLLMISFYGKMDYKIFETSNSTFKYLVGFDITFDFNDLFK